MCGGGSIWIKKCSTNLGTSQKYAAHFIKHEKGDDDVGDECEDRRCF